MTLLAYGDVGTGSTVMSTSAGRVMNALAFTVPSGGAVVRIDCCFYTYRRADADYCLHLSDDDFATYITTAVTTGDAEVLVPMTIRTDHNIKWIRQSDFCLVDLPAGNWKVQAYHIDNDDMDFAGDNQVITVTAVETTGGGGSDVPALTATVSPSIGLTVAYNHAAGRWVWTQGTDGKTLAKKNNADGVWLRTVQLPEGTETVGGQTFAASSETGLEAASVVAVDPLLNPTYVRFPVYSDSTPPPDLLDPSPQERVYLTVNQRFAHLPDDVGTLIASQFRNEPGNPWTVDAYHDAVMADSPLLYYRLGEATGAETLYDASGNGYHWTIPSGTFVSREGVNVTDGGRDRSSDHGNITLGDVGLTLGTVTNFSVEYWMYIDTGYALSSWFGVGGLYNPTSGHRIYFQQWSSTESQTYVRLDNTALGNHTSSVHTGSNGTWYHYVITVTATNRKFYVNGSQVDNDGLSSGSWNFTTSDTLLYLPTNGRHQDEIALYDYELTSTQVSNHFNARIT